MKLRHTKTYIAASTAVLAGICTLSSSVFALAPGEMLKPSLTQQMARQNIVNEQYARDKVIMRSAENLRIIRERNQARMAARNQHTEYAASETPTLKNNPPTTNTLQPSPRIQVASNIVTPTPRTHSESPRNSEYRGNIDMTRVQEAWLGWNNTLRSELGLHPYTIHPSLNATAQEWSEFSRDRGYIIHGRPGDGCVGEKNW